MAVLNGLVGSALPLLAIFFVLWYGVTTYLQYRKLQHIRGPWIASVSPLWLFYHTVRGRVNIACEEAITRYGSPTRVGPGMIIIDDPIIVRHMAAPRSTFIRGHWFQGMKFGRLSDLESPKEHLVSNRSKDPRVDNVLSMTDEKRHAELRAKLMPGVSQE